MCYIGEARPFFLIVLYMGEALPFFFFFSFFYPESSVIYVKHNVNQESDKIYLLKLKNKIIGLFSFKNNLDKNIVMSLHKYHFI